MLKAQSMRVSDLNRWLNPCFSDPAAVARLSSSRRMARALLITARNGVWLVTALLALIQVMNLLPIYLVVPMGVAAPLAVYWGIVQRDARGEEVSRTLLLLLFGLVLGLLAYLRSLADQAGFTTHYTYVIDLDKALFAGTVPSVWLQEQLHSVGHIRPLDVYAGVIYFSYFGVPLFTGVALWHWSARGLRLYVFASLVVALLGSLCFTAAPTAPPWLAGFDGHLPELTRIAPFVLDAIRPGVYEQGYQTVGINEVAAFPSYHMAQTVLVALAAWRYWPRLRTVALVYTASMGFSLVYLAEHYATDILAGLALALFAWGVALRLTPAAAVATSERAETPAELRPAA